MQFNRTSTIFFLSNSKLYLSLCGEMNQRKEVVLLAVVSTYYLNKSDNFLYTYLVNLTWTVEGRGFVELLFCEFCVISNTHNMSLIVRFCCSCCIIVDGSKQLKLLRVV